MTTFVLHIAATDLPEDAIEQLLARLPTDEFERAEGMGWSGRRAEFTLGRSLLRHGFARVCPHGFDWQLQCGPNGKPELKPGQHDGLHFNIAHTDGVICCAYSEAGRVGLDVERLSRGPTIDGVKDRVFSDRELSLLDGLTGDERTKRLLELWTGKEAITKALGEGLSYDFRTLELEFGAGAPHVIGDVTLKHWRMENRVLLTEHFATLALEAAGSKASWEAVSLASLLEFNR